MKWLPIAGAKKDGTEYDLWITPNSMRIANCKFMDGAWREFDNHEASWVAIDKFNVTHYCEITPPQEPLSWPTESGWYWIKNIEGIQWRKLELLPDTDDERGRAFVIDQWVVYEDIATDWKFLPAPVPSFGDAP